MPNLDPEERRRLIRKYNRPGPRYTSYPTALQFAPVGQEDLLADVRHGTGPLSLYFHLPFCESLCWFCACTTVITRNPLLADTYLEGLEREVALFRPNLDPARKVEQIHLGGGSPSFLNPAQLDRLGKLIHANFSVLADAECSVELDPRGLSREQVETLARHGFRRASFGVQDLDPEVQKAVHRVQPDALNRQALAWIRAAGYHSVNIDLIYGLPHQTVASFSRTLEQVITYQPDRLAIFSYAHVPWVAPAQRILERASLPDPETKLAMLEAVIGQLTAAGYRYIGMDHFARAGDELVSALDNGTLHRNFQGYSTRAGRELCGFGMSAISQSGNAYRQNHKELNAWHAALAAGRLPIERGYLLSDDDRIRRQVIAGIMCAGRFSFAATSAASGIDARAYFAREWANLDDFAADGLIERDPDGFTLTPLGRLLMRNVAMRFDAHLAELENRHAKTI